MSQYERLRQTGLDLQALERLATQHRWQLEIDLEDRLLRNETIVVTDDAQRIVFASAGLETMTGFENHEVIGKRPSMFQGPGTDPAVRAVIREAIAGQLPFRAVVVNYRKDHTPYQCAIEAYPLRDDNGRLVHFIAFEQEIRTAV